MLAHLRHHQTHPEGVQVWFLGRQNAVVASAVRELDIRLARWWREALKETGMLAETPDFNAELLVGLGDRMFEFVFSAERTPPEQETIVLSFVDMIAGYMESFATPTGLAGVSAERFLLALDEEPAQGAATGRSESRARAVGQ